MKNKSNVVNKNFEVTLNFMKMILSKTVNDMQALTGLWIKDYGLRIMNYGLRIMNYGLWIMDYGLRIMD